LKINNTQKPGGHRAKYVAYIGVFAALAIIMGWAERFAPIPIPGVRLGLGNGVVLLVLYLFGVKSAFGVMLVKILVSGFLFGNPIGMAYSIAGGLTSFLVMVTLKHSNVFGIVGVSAAAAVVHNTTQIFVAAHMLQSFALMYYLPVLIIAGVIAGVLTGVLALLALNRLAIAASHWVLSQTNHKT